MCGIVGYVGRRDACPILIKGLHRLEYRGYDSAGVALVNPDGRLNVFKCKGKVSDLEHFLDGKDLGGNIGIVSAESASSPPPAGPRTGFRTTPTPIPTTPNRRT